MPLGRFPKAKTYKTRLPLDSHYPFPGVPEGSLSCHSCLCFPSVHVSRCSHNPKGEGSNPSPATKSPQQLARIAFLPHLPTSTLISKFRSGFRFWCAFASRRSQRGPAVVTSVYAGNGMHVDAKGTVGRYPVLLVRATLRHLRSRLQWGLAELETAAGALSSGFYEPRD